MSYDTQKLIVAKDLRKSYLLHKKPSDVFWDMMIPERLKRVANRFIRIQAAKKEVLKGINLTINRGECLGIIGRNGAGKSTLLRIIAKTLPPTSGEVEVTGRLAALLDLTTGFNPRFTGVENIYNYCKNYNVSDGEIKDKLSPIMEFADIGEYIHMPLSTYSSGMKVRLAFACIAHLDADILMIDEALSVGDLSFTQKCMRFLHKFKEEKTLVFVTHSMNSVKNLCDRVAWIDSGVVRKLGSANDVTREFMQDMHQQATGLVAEQLKDPEKTEKKKHHYSGFTSGAIEIKQISMLEQGTDNTLISLSGGENIRIEFRIKVNSTILQPIIGFEFRDRYDQIIFGDNTSNLFEYIDELHEGESYDFIWKLKMPFLKQGEYSIGFAVADGTPENHIKHFVKHDCHVLSVTPCKVVNGVFGVVCDLELKQVNNKHSLPVASEVAPKKCA